MKLALQKGGISILLWLIKYCVPRTRELAHVAFWRRHQRHLKGALTTRPFCTGRWNFCKKIHETVSLTDKQGIAVIRGRVLRVDAWCEKKTGIPALPYFNSSTQRLEIIHTTVSKERLGMCIRSRVKGRLRNPVLHSIEQSTRKRVSDYPCTDSLPDSSCQTCFSLLTNLSSSSVVLKRTSKV